jgi:hypothetical protein
MRNSAHDDAASVAVDCIYDLQAVDATYTPSGGSAATVKVLVDDRTRGSQDKQGSRSKTHMLRGSVRVSEVEELGRGDTIQLSGETIVFKVLPSSVNCDGLEWDFEASAEVATTLGNVQTIPDR